MSFVAPRFRPLCASVASALILGAAPSLAAEGEKLSLEGTWFVLIHYRDSMTANSDADRWEDKVWKIGKKGSRLQWVEYPFVIFNDKSGRFGRVGRNPRARILHNWEPNEGQLAELAVGPQVNNRGSKTKSLRGSPKRGYKSGSGSRSASAMTVGYHETWSIDDPTGTPVFTRDDALGTEADLATGGDVASGRTRYTTLEVLDGGNILQGTYTRDENKKGTFRLIRSGAARGIESDGRSPNEKRRDREREQFRARAQDAAYSEFLKSLGDDRVRALRAQLGEDGLSAIWKKYERQIIGGDTSASQQLGDELREAFVASLLDDAVEAIRDWDGDAVAAARAAGAPPKRIAFLENVRDTVGEEKVAQLHGEYADSLKAGDAKAEQAVRNAVRNAYNQQMEAEFRDRLEQGDSEAMQKFRGQQQKERDRR